VSQPVTLTSAELLDDVLVMWRKKKAKYPVIRNLGKHVKSIK